MEDYLSRVGCVIILKGVYSHALLLSEVKNRRSKIDNNPEPWTFEPKTNRLEDIRSYYIKILKYQAHLKVIDFADILR